MSYPLDSQSFQTTTQSLGSGATIFTIQPAVPVEIISFGVIITTLMVDAGSGLLLTLWKNLLPGSTSGRVSLGTLTLTTAQVTAMAAVGNVLRSRKVLYNTSQSGAFTNSGAATEGTDPVLPGQELTLVVTTQITSGYGIPFIEYKALPRLDRATSIELIVTS